jgi:3-oxoadipate enol-lactonase
VVSRRAADHYLERAAVAEAKGVEAVRTASVEDAAQCFAVSPAEVVEAYRAVRREAVRDARGFVAAARAMASLREAPLTPALGGIRCPALVVTGERDVFCPPRASEIIAAAIPGARLAIIPRVGHCLHWEDAGGFTRLVLDFLGAV